MKISSLCIYIFLTCLCSSINAQNQLIVYNTPSGSEHNNDFNVQVRSNAFSSYQDLYEFQTWVQRGPIKNDTVMSSFVYFDYTGSVEVKIEVLMDLAIDGHPTNTIDNVVIRPLDKGMGIFGSKT